MSGPGTIEAEQVDRCQLCGAIAETRPYGPHGEEVCFACGMNDEEAARERCDAHLFGEGLSRHKVRRAKGR